MRGDWSKKTVAAWNWLCRRERLFLRAILARKQLKRLSYRMRGLKKEAIIAVIVVRNEALRLPYFLEHYRRLGVDHFLFVDNGSSDETREILCAQSDVSLWAAEGEYRVERFGLNWVTCLLAVYGHKRWCLTLDCDELLVYPYHETRSLKALTQWLDQEGQRSYPAMMLDLYPKGPLGEQVYSPGQDPCEILTGFDFGNYTIERQNLMGNLWIQGGARARFFFKENPRLAPTLTKIPLVKWHRRYVYVNSTHSLLPPHLNAVYGEQGESRASGVLLHTKFLDNIVEKSLEELERGQHFSNVVSYKTYYEKIISQPDLWHDETVTIGGWRKFEALGLLSRGGWF